MVVPVHVSLMTLPAGIVIASDADVKSMSAVSSMTVGPDAPLIALFRAVISATCTGAPHNPSYGSTQLAVVAAKLGTNVGVRISVSARIRTNVRGGVIYALIFGLSLCLLSFVFNLTFYFLRLFVYSKYIGALCLNLIVF